MPALSLRPSRKAANRMAFGVTAVLVALALGACDLGDDRDEPTGSARIDSAERFSGQERDVAEAIEGLEAAIRADDAGHLCRRVLIARSRPGLGRRSCAEDPDNRATAELRGTMPDAYDLIVRTMAIHRLGNGPIPLSHRANPQRARRRISERDLQAGAVVTVRRGQAESMELFTLLHVREEWRVLSRGLVRPISSSRARDRSRLLSPPGPYWGELQVRPAAVPRCRSHRFVTVSHGPVAPRRAPSSRRVVLRSSPDGSLIRRGLERGGSLVLAGVDYREPERTWAYQSPRGRVRVLYPVSAPGPRYYLTSVSSCDSWLRRTIPELAGPLGRPS